MPEPISPVPVAPASDTGLDVSFAQLFGGGQPDITPTTSAPITPENPLTPPTSDPNVQPLVQQPPVVNSSDQLSQAFELATSTGTIYKSKEDAVKGIEHKDTLISQLRQFAMERTGIDPLTGQPVQQQFQQPQMQQPQQMQPQQQQPQGYLNNPQQYFQDLYQAYANNDPQGYFAAQQRLIQEQTQSQMEQQYAPYIGILMEQSKSNAVAKVSGEVADFNKFHGSNSYRETLQKFPALAQAISVSENNIQYAPQLGDLYKMVHQLHQAATLPELIKQQQAAISPQLPVRPTTQSTSIMPPQTVSIPRNPNLTDSDQRKAVIEAFERSGKADATWRK